MDSARIFTPSPSDISPEQARDARARAWAFVFQCWQAKKMAAEPTPQPDGRDGKEGAMSPAAAHASRAEGLRILGAVP